MLKMSLGLWYYRNMAKPQVSENPEKTARKRRNDRNHLIYRLTDTLTGEKYIGLTVCKGRAYWKSLATRWQKHVYHACVENRPHLLQQRIRAHGETAFEYEILYIVRGKPAAHELERSLIRKHAPALNVECTGRKARR